MANDAKKNQRIIELDGSKLAGLIKEKGELVEAGRAESREMVKAQERFEQAKKTLESLAGKVGTASRRIFKEVKKQTKGKLGEWELPLTTEIRDGKVVLIIEDALETFKDEFRARDRFSAPAAPKKALSDPSN